MCLSLADFGWESDPRFCPLGATTFQFGPQSCDLSIVSRFQRKGFPDPLRYFTEIIPFGSSKDSLTATFSEMNPLFRRGAFQVLISSNSFVLNMAKFACALLTLTSS